MIDSIRQDTGCSIRLICSTLGLPRSSYYHAAIPTPTQLGDKKIGGRIEEVFWRHRRRYGYRRIYEELLDQDVQCSTDRVRRLMKTSGLRAIQPKSYVPKTSDGRADKPSENLLVGKPMPQQPNQVWAGDITHIPTKTGWLYLAVIIDLHTRRVIGWALADNMRASLVVEALIQALASTGKIPGCIFHSDRGSQYGSKAFRKALKDAGMIQSMSARANPYHNAWTESMIGTLKAEMLQDGCFQNEEDARTELFAYIESYYNTQRKHSSLGYKTPAEFETNTNIKLR
jgi:putative transposase